MVQGSIEMKNGRRKTAYPAERAPYSEERRTCSWRGRPVGRDALVVMYFALCSRGNSDQLAHKRDFKKSGITNALMRKWLQSYLPEFFDDYRSVVGREVPDHLLMGRVYMWFLLHEGKGRGCRAGISPEHPTQWAGSLIEEWDKRIKEHG